MLGNVATTPSMATNPTTCVLTKNSMREFASVASDIAERGSIPGIQLAEAPSALEPQRKWRTPDQAKELDRLREMTANFSAAEIARCLQEFADCAARAADCGFTAIQMHAAHGYFLSLLLNPDCNVRNDEYALKEDWLESFVQTVRGRLSASSLLSFRTSIYAGFSSELTEFDSTLALTKRLAGLDVDYIDLSAGFYTIDRTLIYPVAGKDAKSELPYYGPASTIARQIAKPIVFAGNLRDVRSLPPDMPDNLIVAAARALIADPAFAEKSARGAHDEVVGCDRNNECHYFTRGKQHIACGVNPQLGSPSHEY